MGSSPGYGIRTRVHEGIQAPYLESLLSEGGVSGQGCLWGVEGRGMGGRSWFPVRVKSRRDVEFRCSDSVSHCYN